MEKIPALEQSYFQDHRAFSTRAHIRQTFSLGRKQNPVVPALEDLFAVDFLLDRAARDQAIDNHVARLPDAEGAIHGLSA
jgi:hypothetical protein